MTDANEGVENVHEFPHGDSAAASDDSLRLGSSTEMQVLPGLDHVDEQQESESKSLGGISANSSSRSDGSSVDRHEHPLESLGGVGGTTKHGLKSIRKAIAKHQVRSAFLAILALFIVDSLTQVSHSSLAKAVFGVGSFLELALIVFLLAKLVMYLARRLTSKATKVTKAQIGLARRRRHPSPEYLQARDLQQRYRAAWDEYGTEVNAAEATLKYFADPKGKRICSGGGVVVYERWIQTPQGGGSIIGVSARANDATLERQRLTATRMLAFGIFSLAAPKKIRSGHAYVSIEGPEVNGVAVFPPSKNAGPVAFDFAARINAAARQAQASEKERLVFVKSAKKELKAARRATDDLDAIEIDYQRAIDALSPEERAEFQDIPEVADEPE